MRVFRIASFRDGLVQILGGVRCGGDGGLDRGMNRDVTWPLEEGML